MTQKTLHLVCNAHIDPVWLWDWEEGLAETLSTFRVAVRFCEECDGFVFNHNESLLYEWVEEFEPELFRRIQELVKAGRWHIMGGWYVQPDCNMPSGESLVRQILVGKGYFMSKFGVEPQTAVNLDSFGHSRGLVQILKKSGFTSYLFCRPDGDSLDLPGDDFVWQGFDGSEIVTHRAADHYNSEMGKVGDRIESWIHKNHDRENGLLLWGIGNHGGGPSSEDLGQIEQLQQSESIWNIRHGAPEAYFKSLKSESKNLPVISKGLNPWAVGCYSSMSGVKRKHRELENAYLFTEKMAANAAVQNLADYPRTELDISLKDLLFSQFHDSLPGTSIPSVEKYILQRMDHALEILRRLRAKLFFLMVNGEQPAQHEEFPIIIYNPHPHDLNEIIEFEFQPPEPNMNPDVYLQPAVFNDSGDEISCQVLKESSNLAKEHRKRIQIRADLKASALTRYSCYLRTIARKHRQVFSNNLPLSFSNQELDVAINVQTGCMDMYRVDGRDYLGQDAFRLLLMKDDADPWGMRVRSFRDQIGDFRLMTPVESAEFAGVSSTELAPVRIIEQGDISTVVEALFICNRSAVCVRYKIPRQGKEIEVEFRIYWAEKDKTLKLSIPTKFSNGKCRGQVAYGSQDFDSTGDEQVCQQWVGILSEDQSEMISIINDSTYGFDFHDGELQISLLRAPAYAGHPVDDLPIVPQDRFEPRIDQGEHVFRFWLSAGSAEKRLNSIDREAMVKHQAPYTLCCYPAGTGKKILPGVSLSNPKIQLTALKMAQEMDWLIVRLFNPVSEASSTRVLIPALNVEMNVAMKAYEIRTLAVDTQTTEHFEVDLLERKITNKKS